METPYVLTVTVREASERASPQRPRSGVIDFVLVWGMFLLLAFAVLAFGTTEPWSIFVLECGSAALFLVWVYRQWLEGKLEFTNPAFVPMAIFAAVVLGQWLLGRSASPYSTHTEVWKYVAYGMLFVVADTAFRNGDARRRFLMALSLFGFLVALFAIAQNSAGNEKIYWLRTTQWKSFFGPYVNRNHYAGLMEMLAPVPLAFCFSRRLDFWKKTLLALFSTIMGITIFLSGSRGGLLAFSMELVFFAALLTKSFGWKRTVPAILVFSLIAFAGMSWLDRGQAMSRIGSLQHPLGEEVVGARLSILQDGLRMFRMRPILGWGLGAFPDIYPQYRSFYTDFFINEAHNDYLQVLIETGVIGFAAVLGFLVLLYRNSLRGLHATKYGVNPVKLGVLAGCTGLLLHSATDFNLHIPANAALFFVFCALATAGHDDAVLRRTTSSGKIRIDRSPERQPY